MLAALEHARRRLAQVPGVASCAVGLEANLSPEDYPMVRLVPRRIVPGQPYQARRVETLVYFGAPISNSEGLSAVYSQLFAMELALLDALRELGARYVETIADEDRLDTYKIMALLVELPDTRRLSAASTLRSSYAITAP
jgi:hypothetical protein